MKNSRKMRGVLVMLIAFAFCFLAEPVKADDRTALDGIYVEDISVGGMTEEQITQAVNDKIEQLKPSVINLSAGEQNAQVTAGDLGLSCANPEVAREAVTIGQEGNVLKRFLTQNRLKNGETVTFSLKYTVDGEAARQAVENNTAVLNREATDATLTRENGEFIVNPGQTGCSVNVDESTAKVVNYLTTSWRGGIGGVELVTEETPAGGNPEQLALVKDLLGEGTTEYGNGTSGRKQNVAVGAEKINGTLVQPGEEFSVEAVVVPFDAENGYALAASYEMGKVVDSYGGGICQVSTTLYVAVLKAELEVTERYSHSMIVHYVDPSMDAAIAEGALRFTMSSIWALSGSVIEEAWITTSTLSSVILTTGSENPFAISSVSAAFSFSDISVRRIISWIACCLAASSMLVLLIRLIKVSLFLARICSLLSCTPAM